jgi:toxin-antitoxin system PIN domain toxin
MILMDVNILVYAHREDTPDHPAYRDWVEDTINSGSAYGVSELVLSGFIRVVTHPKVFERPTPLVVALDVVNQIRGQPQAVPIRPGPRHWAIFEKFLRSSEAKGNLVPDAYHAALAIESGCDWITTDKGFLRFPGLRARHPLRKAL